MQFTRNRVRIAMASTTTCKQSTMNDEAFTCLAILIGRAPCWSSCHLLEGRLRECDNPAMSRLETPFGYDALTSSTKSRVALLHTEVPQGQGYGSPLAHGVF
jgi:hypothetical protein